jgi:hypothetical protein
MKDARILRNIRVWDSKTQTSVLIDLDVEVDVNWIGQQLAAKAYNNKARKSHALHGLVEVRVRGTKATPVEGAA